MWGPGGHRLGGYFTLKAGERFSAPLIHCSPNFKPSRNVKPSLGEGTAFLSNAPGILEHRNVWECARGQWGECLVTSMGGIWTLGCQTSACRLWGHSPVLPPQEVFLAEPALRVGTESCDHVSWESRPGVGDGAVLFLINTWLPGSSCGGLQGEWLLWGEGHVPACPG